MDYGHNVNALAAVADFVRRTAVPETVGVFTVPGDLRDDDVRAFGELAGRTFHRVVIREDVDSRGRARGEIAAMLVQAVTEAGWPAERIAVVYDEVEAVHAGIDLAAPGSLVVVMVDRIPLIWRILETRAAGSSPRHPKGPAAPPRPALAAALL